MRIGFRGIALGTALAFAMVFTSGCVVSVNDLALKLGAPPEGAVALRAKQTRRFDTLDEAALLAAAIESLLDLGFTVSETSHEVGLLTAAKQRDAVESGGVAGGIALTIFAAALGAHVPPTWDKTQNIRVTLVSTPIENSKQMEVRVSFNRRMTNNHGQFSGAELIMEPEIYQKFFEKLAASAFLEAHEI